MRVFREKLDENLSGIKAYLGKALPDENSHLNVRKINDSERLLEFYVSIYPDEYDRTSRMFLSELKRVIKNPRISDMIEISGVGFTTYKSIGVKDFHQYQYN